MMRAWATFAMLVAATPFAWTQRVGAPTDDLTKVSVDELFNIEVTSVGRKAQKLSKAPAAVYVLTGADMRRAGVKSIPEALRLVPGMTVLSIDGRSWAISARGDTHLYSNKLLVMLDGRTVYWPIFSGVIWESIGVFFEDIDRIEVIRGPGAVMWGPNAVDGVINIITKSTESTTGTVVSVSAGSQDGGEVAARWGSAPSEHFAYRIWGQLQTVSPESETGGLFSPRTGTQVAGSSLGSMESQSGRMGFRAEGDVGAHSHYMVQGDAYRLGQQDPMLFAGALPGSFDRLQGHSGLQGGFLQGRWTRSTSADRESSLLFSYDKSEVEYPFAGGSANNLTVDYQERRQTSDRNEIYYGGGFEQYWDSTFGYRLAHFTEPESLYRVGNVVFRDEFQPVMDRLMVSFGARVDYTSYTRFEWQPSFRLLFTPSARQSVWFALSRAVRVPSRFDRDIQFDEGTQLFYGIPVTITGNGNHSMRSETVRSVESGYRFQSGQRWSMDLSLFASYYSRLRAMVGLAQPVITFVNFQPQFSLPLEFENLGTGRSLGGEVSATWQLTDRWRLLPSYSYLREARWLPNQPGYIIAYDADAASLAHQGILRAERDITRNWQCSVTGRARSRNASIGSPGVLMVDARLGWRPVHWGELSLSVEDLLDREVIEMISEGPFVAIPTRRTVRMEWTQRF